MSKAIYPILISLLTHSIGFSAIWAFSRSAPPPHPAQIVSFQVRSSTLGASLNGPLTGHPKKKHRALPQKAGLNPSLAKTSAPSHEGTGPGNSGAGVSRGIAPKCLDQIHGQIEASLDYPLSIRRRKIQGKVTLKMGLDSQGQVESLSVAKTSGYPELDQLALEAVSRAKPFVCLSEKEKMTGKLSLSLPVDFKLD